MFSRIVAENLAYTSSLQHCYWIDTLGNIFRNA